jgi:heme-degrading monooxygenase HmoA
MLPFTIYSLRSASQARRSPGFLGGWLGSSGNRSFWTVTVWDDEAAMKRFRDSGIHKAAMPKMLNWADEGAMARYQQDHTEPPTGAEAMAALDARGRTSKVHHPTPAHAAGKTVPDGRPPFVGRVLSPAG